jgi:hypothetical protein
MIPPPSPKLRDYARSVLAALRRDRDWYRSAARRIEDDGGRICRTEWDGTAWTVFDWRTGTVLASGAGHDAYDAAWDPGWTDTGWVDRLLEDWQDRRRDAASWPDGIPMPPPAAPEPSLYLPGVPPPLAALLAEVVSCWACQYDPDDPGHTADVAALTGLTARQVAACAASHYQLDGATFTDLAAETQPGIACPAPGDGPPPRENGTLNAAGPGPALSEPARAEDAVGFLALGATERVMALLRSETMHRTIAGLAHSAQVSRTTVAKVIRGLERDSKLDVNRRTWPNGYRLTPEARKEREVSEGSRA